MGKKKSKTTSKIGPNGNQNNRTEGQLNELELHDNTTDSDYIIRDPTTNDLAEGEDYDENKFSGPH